jgi:hypothetical protein
MKLKRYDISFLVTAIRYENNYFYSEDNGICIISFAEWHELTTLPMSNGAAYFICQLILKYYLKIGVNHDDNTGCINDFLWNKTGIDLGMRAAFICNQCEAKSYKNQNLNSAEFSDIESILNAVSTISRKGTDILLDLSLKSKTQPTARNRFDLFLCHNSKDKPAVRKLNEVLKSGGIRTWLDEEQIKPGDLWQTVLESQISQVAACLVIVGDSGLAPWQDVECRAFISEFVNRGCKVIPVLVGNASAPPELPLFLRQYMWSDLREDDGRQIVRIIAAVGSERGQNM